MKQFRSLVLLIVSGLQFSCANRKQAPEALVLNTTSLDRMEVYNVPESFDTESYRKRPFRLYT